MFDILNQITRRPKPFEFYTAEMLWNDRHISKKMLELHLDENVDLASRNKAFIDKSIAWMTSRFNIGPDMSICDFGCGPGLYTSRFASLGASTVGVDFSERSIEYAREVAAREQLRAEYVHQNYLEFSTDKKFDLITMIYCDFCPLSPRQRQVVFGKFREHLKTGGSVFLDVLSVRHFETTRQENGFESASDGGFWSAEPYFEFKTIFKYEQDQLILSKHTIIERDRVREIYNWLQCYSLETLAREFEQNGFKIVESYSDVAGTPFSEDSPQLAIVAKAVG